MQRRSAECQKIIEKLKGKTNYLGKQGVCLTTFFINQTYSRKPLIIRIGYYNLDATPLIGKIVDINAWDRCSYSISFNCTVIVTHRLISHEEAMDITNCIKYTKTTPGNCYNETFNLFNLFKM